MCQACPSPIADLRKRRLAKLSLGPEEERVFREWLQGYRAALQPVEQSINDWVSSATESDLESLDAIRAELDAHHGRYAGDFETLFQEMGREGLEAGRSVATRRFGLDIVFDQVPGRAIDAVDDWVETAAGSTFETITDDAAQWLRGAHEDGLSIDEITDVINDELHEGRLEDHVARRAARTGTVSTSRAGHHSAHEDAPGVVAERWISELRDNTREDHEEAHGQVVAVDQEFAVGAELLEHPGDPSASVGQIANCLCYAEPVFEDELTDGQLEALEAGERLWITP